VMRLLFDIGNTRIKWVLEVSGDFEFEGVVAHKEFDMSNLQACLDQLSSGVESIWASSVASKEVEHQLEGWASQFLQMTINWADVQASCAGVVNGYEDLSRLGVDRWMAVLGANQYKSQHGLSDCNVVIIDAGTAVTIELLTVKGCYQGGVILPGLRLMHDSLVGQTEGIVSKLVDSVSVLGQNTQACVNSGVRFGLLGAIERVLNEILSLPEVESSQVLVLLTGGDADFIAENSNLDYKIEPQLVLSGLSCVANIGVEK